MFVPQLFLGASLALDLRYSLAKFGVRLTLIPAWPLISINCDPTDGKKSELNDSSGFKMLRRNYVPVFWETLVGLSLFKLLMYWTSFVFCPSRIPILPSCCSFKLTKTLPSISFSQIKAIDSKWKFNYEHPRRHKLSIICSVEIDNIHPNLSKAIQIHLNPNQNPDFRRIWFGFDLDLMKNHIHCIQVVGQIK